MAMPNCSGTRVFVALSLALSAACKEPVEDQVPSLPAPAVARGQPSPEARAFVLAKAPPVRYPVNATFEDQIVLLGYDVPKIRFRPGEQVPITLYWKALVDVPDNWQVFMHLDPAGIDNPAFRGYGDHYPVFGLYPTHQWKAGQIVRDQVTLPLRENVRTPTAELWVGLYIDARRAKLKKGAPSDGRDRLKMAVLQVEGIAGATPGLKRYTVYRAGEKLVIDGRLDEASWQRVPTTGRFVRTVGGAPAKLDTWAKLLWDDDNLYVAFYCADPDIRSPYEKRDEPLWQADAVEIFIDADGDGKTYVELQVSPANVVFDAFFPARGPAGKRGGDLGYTAGIRSAVRVNGTLNRPGDRDRSWMVEMAIPLKDIKHAPRTPPRVGDVWRAHLIRVERSAGEVDDSAWAPPGNDYHNLDAMGQLVFADAPGKVAAGAPAGASRRRDLVRLLGKHPRFEKRLLGDGGLQMSRPPP